MLGISPRDFEILVADLAHRLGYEDVHLTPASRDGGYDVLAIKKSTLGTVLYLIECKRHAFDNHVGIGIVDRLCGAAMRKNATAGIVATTSFFTKPAVNAQKELDRRFELSLRDFNGIIEWLKLAQGRTRLPR